MTEKVVPKYDWYVSGPMTGVEEYNFPEFNRVTTLLKIQGYTVSNPAEKGIQEGWSWEDYLRWDLVEVIKSRGIVTLDGWEDSPGANLECYVAKALKMPIYHYKEVLG